MTTEERLNNLEAKQREQDEKIKRLEEKIKLSSLGFPTIFL